MGPVGALLALGFVLGMRHATDADHVVAVTTIVGREGRIGRAAAIGVLWGLGHTLTIVAVGGAIIAFGLVIPPRIGLSMELSVGVVLVLLGIASLAALRRAPEGVHVPASGPGESAGAPDHAGVLAGLSSGQIVRPLVTGVVHGLAGSAAIALLVLATIREPRWGVAYLVVFGIGTVAGMMIVTAAVGVPFAVTARRSERWNRWLRLLSGAGSIAFGLVLVYRFGWLGGLFVGTPNWVPH